MRSIGIRQLRQQASRYLRDVRDGESFAVTDRGEPVAWLVPVPRASGLGALEAGGRLRPADGDLLDLGAPLRPARGRPRPSDTLAAMRDDER